MKYVFGPVPSRRLGQSLGVDPIPHKTCNWNCIYCQLGRTRPLTNLRKEYFPAADILAEVRSALQAHKPGEIDWVTFVGSGEPLLNASIGWLLRQVKRSTELPVALITNGSLLYLGDVREEILEADAVLPSLDAGGARIYRQISRPHPDITFDRLLEGLIDFREEYQGKMWLEVMLVRGINDNPQVLWDLAKAIQWIKPDAVHINLPTRPPAETWVQPPYEESLMQAVSILGNSAQVVHPAEGSFDLGGYDDPMEAIIRIISRHPMRQEELERSLNGWSPGQVSQALADLEASEQALVVERYGVRFWTAPVAYYPDKVRSSQAILGQRYQYPEK
ncbi:MAG: radical SAM protein [Chloroflexota bacterium]